MKFLVILNNHNSFKILDLCKVLQQQLPNVEYRIACDSKYYTEVVKRAPELAKTAIQIQTQWITTNKNGAEPLATKPKSSLIRTLVQQLREALQEHSLRLFLKEWIIYRRIENCKMQALKALSDYQPDTLFSMSDRSHDYVESPLLWAAHQKRIPVVLPYIANYSIESAYAYRFDAKRKQVTRSLNASGFSLYRIYSRMFLKKQIYKNCFFQEPAVLNAHRRSGTLSKFSWWVGHGLSDIVCVNSAYIKNTYLSHGVAEEKLLIAGDTSCKELYDSFSKRKSVREQLNSRYSFDPKKKILLLSMPQFFEQGYIDEKTHWDDIHYILSQLSLCEVNLAISLHPRQEAARYQFLSEKYPATFIAESLSTVIGAVDYFVCAQSSTLTWSALCGVPALNFDFHLGVDLYHYLESVRHITTKLQFEKELRTMLREPATGFEEDWKNLSRDIAFREDFSQTFIDQCAQALKNAGFYSSFK